MHYYKQLNELGEVEALYAYEEAIENPDDNVIEISKEEYDFRIAEIKARSAEQTARYIEAEKLKTEKAQAYDIITGVSE